MNTNFIKNKLLRGIQVRTLAVFSLSSLIIFTACPEKKKSGLLDEWGAATLFAVNLVDQANGTVKDIGSGRIWMKCNHGQVWNAALNNCAGTGAYTTYGAASVAFCTIPGGCIEPTTLQANSGPAFNACNDLVFAGYSDWRLPTKIELLSIIGMRNRSTLLISFPEMPDDKHFWTGEQSTTRAEDSWGISFADHKFGETLSFDKVASTLYVKCIR